MKKSFDWNLYPGVERFLRKQVNSFLLHSPAARKCSIQMEKCSTEFFDWIDHIILPKNNESKLTKFGFTECPYESADGIKVFELKSSIFFPVLTHEENSMEIVLKPEHLDIFTDSEKILGKADAPYRYARIAKNGEYLLSAVERRGYTGFLVQKDDDIKIYKQALQAFRKRRRTFKTDAEGFRYTKKYIHSWKLTKGRVADAFFRAEREYWQSRNTAGRIQYQRQGALGWGNHDHHTYRSSRENFAKLIAIFESLGMVCREQFHSGAGWGAQILEHPECRVVVFADVDIRKSEHLADFAHQGLHKRQDLGTVGLWVGLHGESIFQAGMHHLEARFNFNALRKDLRKHNVRILKPFSKFSFLKQAFTEGELWTVDKKRAGHLLQQQSITPAQYERFIEHGVIGSHMENLERRQGYKGFNQRSVNAIIKATDPRKQRHRGA